MAAILAFTSSITFIASTVWSSVSTTITLGREPPPIEGAAPLADAGEQIETMSASATTATWLAHGIRMPRGQAR